MRRITPHIAAFSGATALILAGAPAQATDWSLKSFLRQTFEVESNRQLEAGEVDPVIGSTTGADVTLSARTKRALTTVRAALSGSVFGGSEGGAGLDRIDPSININHEYRGKNATLSAGGSFATASVESAQADDSGISNVNATQFSGSYNFGLSWRATPRTALSATVNGRVIDFSRSVASLSPSQSVGLNLGASHALTPTTSISLSGGFRFVNTDDVLDTKSRIVDVNVGVSHRRTSRHTLGGNAGVSAVFRETNLDSFDSTIGFNGGGSLEYNANDITGNLSISQSVDSSGVGDVRSFTRLGASLGYAINARQRLGLSANYSRSADVDGGGDVFQFVSLGPTYNYQITDAAALSLGYLLRLDDEQDEAIAASHRVFLNLTRSFTLSP